MAGVDEGTGSLQNQSTDYVASAAKAILGAVPFAGSLLAELAGAIIPNQRLDRIGKFAAELELRIAHLDQDMVRAKLKDENFTDLMEETMRHAARAVSDDRRRYLAALLANGINSSDVTYMESKHLLRILGELNDIEVIWLRSFLDPTLGGDEDFRAQHHGVLKPVGASIGSPQAEIDKHALQASYKEHLARLGLIEPRYETDIRTKQPIFDSFRGGLKLRNYEITSLGRLLLRYIEVGSDLSS
jgi:hypothetical protein